MGPHSENPGAWRRIWTQHKTTWLQTLIIAALAAVLAGATGAIAAPDTNATLSVGCPPGADLIVHPGTDGSGIWSCGPTPGPAGSPSSSPAPGTSASTSNPAPSASSSTSASPAPSTPAPTSASPSPSTTGPSTRCWDDPGACGYPTPATTGVPAGTALLPYTGPSTINSPATIDSKTLGCITVRAAVTITRSRITCPGGIGIEVDGGGVLTLTDSEVSCVTGTGTGLDRSPNGSYAVLRAYIHDCENGLHMESNTSVTDSYIMVRTIGGAHSDGIQGVSGSNIVIRHNTILNADAGGTSSIIFAGQAMPGLVVADNLLSGGTYTLYCPSGGSGITVSGNRFAGPVAYRAPGLGPDYGFSTGCNRAGITWTNNVRDDTGAVISA